MSAPEQVRCPDTKVDSTAECRFGLKAAAGATLQVSGAELAGRDRDDFVITKECDGALRPGTACSIRLRFTPSDEGDRKADVIVELPAGSRVIELRGKGVAGDGPTGASGCADGFVPRDPAAGDNFCVTSAERRRFRRQNQEHVNEDRANDDGTCVQGFVWREATDGDRVCVTPGERDDVVEQNAKHSERSAG